MTDAAQVRQSKRYRAALRKRGRCFACLHRAQTDTMFHCRNNPGRNSTNCEQTPGPRFSFDSTVMGEFADGK